MHSLSPSEKICHLVRRTNWPRPGTQNAPQLTVSAEFVLTPPPAEADGRPVSTPRRFTAADWHFRVEGPMSIWKALMFINISSKYPVI
jgi:hypothetical protein